MSESNVIQLAQPGVFTDCLTEILRSGARSLLTQAVEVEVAEFIAKHADLKTATGHAPRGSAMGILPEREIMTGIGPVAVSASRVCATAPRPRPSASGTRQRSCRRTCDDRRALRC